MFTGLFGFAPFGAEPAAFFGFTPFGLTPDPLGFSPDHKGSLGSIPGGCEPLGSGPGGSGSLGSVPGGSGSSPSSSTKSSGCSPGSSGYCCDSSFSLLFLLSDFCRLPPFFLATCFIAGL